MVYIDIDIVVIFIEFFQLMLGVRLEVKRFVDSIIFDKGNKFLIDNQLICLDQ